VRATADAYSSASLTNRLERYDLALRGALARLSGQRDIAWAHPADPGANHRLLVAAAACIAIDDLGVDVSRAARQLADTIATKYRLGEIKRQAVVPLVDRLIDYADPDSRAITDLLNLHENAVAIEGDRTIELLLAARDSSTQETSQPAFRSVDRGPIASSPRNIVADLLRSSLIAATHEDRLLFDEAVIHAGETALNSVFVGRSLIRVRVAEPKASMLHAQLFHEDQDECYAIVGLAPAQPGEYAGVMEGDPSRVLISDHLRESMTLQEHLAALAAALERTACVETGVDRVRVLRNASDCWEAAGDTGRAQVLRNLRPEDTLHLDALTG